MIQYAVRTLTKSNFILCCLAVSVTFFSLVSCTSQAKPVSYYFTLQETEYQVETDGVKSTFEDGVVYRRPGFPPQISVSGTHYEMGRQYGVLLRPEIQSQLNTARQFVEQLMQETGLSADELVQEVLTRVSPLVKKLPERFQEEFRGISEGAGIPLESLHISTFYSAISESDRHEHRGECSVVMARTAEGDVLHGYMNDDADGAERFAHDVIVKFNPEGYHAYTVVRLVLNMGFPAGYNDAGLRISKNTLSSQTYNDALYTNHLPRLILEECVSLNDVSRLFDTYNLNMPAAFGISDNRNDAGSIFETVPADTPIWGETSLQDEPIWSTNMYHTELKKYEDAFLGQNDNNLQRERNYTFLFEQRDAVTYEFDDIIAILRTSELPGEDDMLRNHALNGICGISNLRMIIFDPQEQGLYMARNPYSAALHDIYFYPDDFAQEPRLYKEGLPLDEKIQEIGRWFSQGRSYEELLTLVEKYPDEPLAQYTAGIMALQHGDAKGWASHCARAYELRPDYPDYKIEAAAIAFAKDEMERAVELLLPMKQDSIVSLRYKVIRLRLLHKAYVSIGEESKAKTFQQELEALPLKAKDTQWLEGYVSTLEGIDLQE